MITSETTSVLCDTTLRDGEQAPGLVFSKQHKLTLAKMLSHAGIAELEVGTPAMGEFEIDTIRAIARLNLPSRLFVWCRAKQQDIDLAYSCNVDAVHISLPVSPIHLRALGKNQQWIMDQIHSIIPYALNLFSFVSVGAQDASRCDMNFLVRIGQAVEAVGAHRLRLADTVGIWNPLQTYQVFSQLRTAVPGLPLSFHGHNDLGMATANTLAALQAGACSADVTVLGVGERAGNAPLEEVVMAGELSGGLKLARDTRQLVQLTDFVSLVAGRGIPADKPIVGQNIFRHESGIHVKNLLQDRATYEPFSPEMLGQGHAPQEFVIGKHSGTAAIKYVLNRLGITIDQGVANRLLKLVRRAAERKGEALEQSELYQLYHQVKDEAGRRRQRKGRRLRVGA